MASAKFLTIGASGFVGRHLVRHLPRERVLATFCNTPVVGGVRFDAATMRLSELLRAADAPVSHAFILGGITNIDACARDPAGTYEINVQGTIRLIDELLAAGIVPIYTSSDAVFDGARGMYTEDDPTSPILTYGRHKAAVEAHLCGCEAPWLIARLSKVVATDPGVPSMFSEWLAALDAKAPVRCAYDQIFSPVAVEDVVAALLWLIERGATGLYNLCGPRAWSRLDLLQALVAELRRLRPVDDAQIVPCSIRDLPLLEARPLDCSMSSAKLTAALGYALQDMTLLCRNVAERAAARSRDPG